MKKILSISIALFLTALGAQAEIKYDLRIGASLVPVAGNRYFARTETYVNNTLADIYGDYRGPVQTTGTFTADMGILFKKWLGMDICLGACPFWMETFNGVTGARTGKKSGVAIYLMPKIRFTFLNREAVRLYANLGVGVGKYFGFDELQYSYATSYGRRYVDNSFKPEIQFVPFGIEFGRKVFGFCEVGVGTMYMGISAGIGYKF